MAHLDVPAGMRGRIREIVRRCPIGFAGRLEVASVGVIGAVFGIAVVLLGVILIQILPVSLPGPSVGAPMPLLILLVLGAVAGAPRISMQRLDDVRAVAVERRLVARQCLRCGAGVMGVPSMSRDARGLVRCPECGRETIRVAGPPGERLRRTRRAPS